MIAVLKDMPQGVTGIRVSGRVHGEELQVFKPVMAKLLGTGEIRLVEVIDDDYEGFGHGGLREDIKIGLGALFTNHSAFKRIALVTDKERVVNALLALPWMVPGEIAIFRLDHLVEAKQWAAGEESPHPGVNSSSK